MRARRVAGGAAKIAFMAMVYLFLLAPLIVVVGASFNGAEGSFINFPPTNLTWRWYGRMDPSQLRALGVSIALELSTALAAALLGVPAAIGLVRAKFKGKALVAAILRSPLQIPAVVIGVAFLKMYYTVGNVTGYYAVGTMVGLFLAHLFMVLPYVISAVAAVLQRFNMRLEEAALSLGASRLSVFRRVTLPIIMPGIYADASTPSWCRSATCRSRCSSRRTAYRRSRSRCFRPCSSISIRRCWQHRRQSSGSIVVMVGLQRLVGMETLLRSSGGK